MAQELKKPVLDPQDPLPESKWFFRRILMFGYSTFLLIMTFWATIVIAKLAFNEPSSSVAAITQLASIVRWLVLGHAGMAVLYLIAPSGEQIAKVAAMASAMRDGISFNGGMGAPDIIPDAPPVPKDEGDVSIGSGDGT